MIIVGLVFMSFSLSESLHSCSPSVLGGGWCLVSHGQTRTALYLSSQWGQQTEHCSLLAQCGLPEQEQDLL